MLPVAPRALLLGHVLHVVVFVISYPPRYSIIQGEKLGERKRRERMENVGEKKEREGKKGDDGQIRNRGLRLSRS